MPSKEEHWLCRFGQAREILHCTRAELELFAKFLPQFQMPMAAFFIVEYLEALVHATSGGKLHIQDSRFRGSLPAFARTSQARRLISEAQELSADILQKEIVSVEEVSTYFNLLTAEIDTLQQHGFLKQKNGNWVVRGKRLYLACKWYIPEV